MSKKIFDTTKKLLLTLVKRANGIVTKGEAQLYTSSIVHSISDSELKITVPIFQSKLVPMTIGDVYAVRFYTAAGYFQCKCLVKSIEKEGHVMLATIKTMSPLEKYQRRQYFRMNCVISVQYAKLEQYQIDLFKEVFETEDPERRNELQDRIDDEEIDYKEGTMLDISGGGLRFNCRTKCDTDDILIVIPDEPRFTAIIPYFICQEVMVRQIGGSAISFEHKMKFININGEQREKLISLIFTMERERMKTDLK